MMLSPFLQQPYKGYTISGSAEPVHNDQSRWFAIGRVLVMSESNINRFPSDWVLQSAAGANANPSSM